MKNFHLLSQILFIIILFSTPLLTESKMTIDLQKSTISMSVFWIRAKIIISGGEYPYIYQYARLPNGWKQVKDFLYIPIDNLYTYKKYPCNLMVRDNSGQQINISYHIIIQQQTVFIDDIIYRDDQNQIQVDKTFLKENYEFQNIKVAEGRINKPSKRVQNFPFTKQDQHNQFEFKGQNFNQNQNNYDPFSFFSQPNNANEFASNGNSFSIPPSSKVQLLQNSSEEVEKKLKNMTPTKNVSDEETNKKVNQAIREAAQQIIFPSRSMDQIFLRLPTFEQLDSIILNADILVISKTIQSVIVSTMTCEYKISYLSELFGRINNQVQMKKISLEKLKLIKALAKQEIQRLFAEVERLNKEQQKLNLFSLNKQLKKGVERLEKAYDEYNEAIATTESAESKLIEYKHKVIELEQSLVERKQEAKQADDKLYLAEKYIYELEKRHREEMRRAVQERSRVEEEVREIDNKIRIIEKSIKSIFHDTQKVNEFLQKAPSIIPRLKKAYSNLEIEVERTRQDISRNTKKQKKILTQIDEIQLRIEEEEEKIRQREIQATSLIIDNLMRNLPNIQDEIDKLYYSCYELFEMIKLKIEKGDTYLVDAHIYEKYLQLAYGKNLTKKILASKKQSNLTITQSSVFSQAWSSKYGSSYQKVNGQTDSLVKNDFHCLLPSKLVTRSGVIKHIINNLIIVLGDDGNLYKLFIGSCSRVESASSKVPKVKQRIIFKGNQVDMFVFKVYSASSF